VNEEIARRLREAAEAHRPDRARMLARVERGMAGPAVRHRARPFARSGTRVALAGLAAGGILTTGGLAVAAIVATPRGAHLRLVEVQPEAPLEES
jgi:hypothetical protein